jgi:glycosyltransferase involved in cell wall biosynthesis
MIPRLRADPRVRRLSVVMPPGAAVPALPSSEVLTWSPADARYGYRGLRARLGALAPDVVFIPTARWLDCRPAATVVMVRNMEPLTVPFGGNALAETARNLVRAHVARLACRRADRVLAVSQYVQDFLTGRWRVPPGKVGLVYHGAERLVPAREAVRPAALDGVGPGGFAFTAGSIRPARGLEDLIRALALTGTARQPAPALVIAGRADAGTRAYGERMRRLAEQLRVSPRIVWVGQLGPPEMAWCYDHCAAFVMTSRAEACPNTALEAMAHGCQIVSTRQPPMPEFFGGAALYYEPGDPAGLARQLTQALTMPSELERGRRDAARAVADRFRWADTADRTIGELARVAARHRGEEGAAWTT